MKQDGFSLDLSEIVHEFGYSFIPNENKHTPDELENNNKSYVLKKNQ